jgi:hypothetical protein
MNYQQKYEQLLAEFEQYKRESIKWSVEDFMENGDITEEQAQQALEAMIQNHDANFGITWETVNEYKSHYKA